MKKTLTFIISLSLAASLSSCDLCNFFAFFMGPVACDFGTGNFIKSLDGALYSNPPAPPPPPNETKKPLPPQQIVGEPISSEPGGGQKEEDRPSSFRDIISSPSFTLGPSVSWLGGDKDDEEKFPARMGFQMGASWQVPLTDGLNFEPGISYANRGVGYEREESGYSVPGDGAGESYSYGQKKNLHYMELPLFVSGSAVKGLDFYGGPQVAFLLGAKVVNESNGQTTSKEKGTDGLNKVDVGLSLGARYQIPKTFFSVSMGYYQGFSNLNDESEHGGYGYDEPKYRMRAARLGIQYNFPAARSYARSGPTKKPRLIDWISK